MTSQDSTVTPHLALSNLTCLSPGATSADVRDRLGARLLQLTALLSTTWGGGDDGFASLNDATQENYLWACSDIADECQKLFGALYDLQKAESA